MNIISRLKGIVADANAKIGALSEGIETAEDEGYYSEATGLLQERDDLRSETYEEIAGIIEDAGREEVWVAAITLEDTYNDEPSVYIHRSFEGLAAWICENWSVDISKVENIHEDLPEHFLRCGVNLTIEQQEIAG